ncbi:hypothetical protein AAKU61_004515 [Undibacterium sp. GrIS 1.2]
MMGAIRMPRLRLGFAIATEPHFNLHGEFDFSDEKMIDSVGLTNPKNQLPRKN